MRRLEVMWFAVLAFVLVVAAGPAMAQTCGKPYTVAAGDSLSEIAQRAYNDASKWSSIYYSNKGIIGKDASLILPGQSFRIPCLGAAAAAAAIKADTGTTATAPAAAASGAITLLTAGDYRPFTDQALPKGGLITDIVSAALTRQQSEAKGPAFKVTWVNDWSAHLNPLLANRAFDMGFPWFQPPCEHYAKLDKPARFRCDTFHFSEPVFEILVLFFTKKGSDFQFATDQEVVGRRLCRPSGYFTFDLDKDGRNWIKDDKVVLMRPQSVDECFRMLEKGEVDAVALNEFTGRAAVKKLGLNDSVRTIERPVSVLNLHVIVAKTHPNALAYLENVNQALKRIKSDGTYGKIVDKHLAVFWASQESG